MSLHVKVNRIKLITILRQNLETHRREFIELLTAWKTQTHEELLRLGGLLNQGTGADMGAAFNAYSITAKFKRPVSHADDYVAAIELLEMATDTDVPLYSDDFLKYVKDQWNWKGEWAATQSNYLGKSSY